jgi:hypothetical protein
VKSLTSEKWASLRQTDRQRQATVSAAEAEVKEGGKRRMAANRENKVSQNGTDRSDIKRQEGMG